MDKNLYQQLLDASTVLLNIYEREKAIKEYTDSIEAGQKRLKKEKENAYRKPRAGWIVWGSILLFFHLMGVIMPFGEVFGGISESNFEDALAAVLTYSIIYIAAAIVFLLPSILLFSKYGILMKQRKRRIQEYEKSVNDVNENIKAMTAAISKSRHELEIYKENTKHYIEFLAPTYNNLTAALYLLKCVRDERADTLKEAKNLYEAQVNSWRLEQILGDMVKMQSIQNEYIANALNEISQNQQNINATLGSIQAVQLAAYFKN